ncbi:MAG TPA: efflux RND transporter periplasmic adaptor subunit [Gemmatimonadaceae bacterium]|nr:efflux RND transporter periplasmic adaptor subunit [Gemmatimonadaceae bacterium]
MRLSNMMVVHLRRAAVGLITLVAACGKKAPERSPSVPVAISPAVKIDAPAMVVANGVVEPVQTVAVEAQVGGILTEVSFQEGEDVTEGQVLFRIDPRPFAAALRQSEAAVARDKAQAQSAERDAERYKALVAKDYVTQSQAEQAQAQAASMLATLQSDSAAVENARVNLGYTTIRAPIGGRTGSLLVRRGNLVKPSGGPLVVINELQPILVRFPVTARDFLALRRRVGSGPVPVRVTASDSTVLPEQGSLTFLDNAVDSLTGSVTAKARFSNSSRALWPGEYLRVAVQLDVRTGAIAIPTTAVLNGQEGTYVYVVDSEKNAHVRTVTVGQSVGDLTVIEHGVVPGEQVVVDGQSRLVPGAKVDAKPQATPVAQRSGTSGIDE